VKYSININQLVLAETSLDIVDAAILDFLTFICNSRNEKVEAERRRDERGSWTWVDYGHLLRDMPLLKITDKSAISRRIQKIEQEGYITTRRVGNQGLYVLLTAKVVVWGTVSLDTK
jgi:hypothetical protein